MYHFNKPLCFPGKESTQLFKEFVPVVEAEIKEIKDDGIKIGVQDDQEILAQ